MKDRAADVVELIASTLHLPTQAVTPASSMETLAEWDSLAHLTICMRFQDRFGVQMDMQTIAEATSVERLTALLV